MTPGDFVLFVDGWRAANDTGGPDAPTADEYAELVKKYG